MNLLKLKGKIFHFINLLFYIVVFILGYLCGSSKINITKLFQIERVYAYYGDSPTYSANYLNYYLPENQNDWSAGTYGYRNPRSMSDYQNYQDFLESHHVFNYLEQVTRYLTDNYSGDYEFVIGYRRFYYNYDINRAFYNLLLTYSNYRNYMYGSFIYVFYFPKGSIDEFPYKSFNWLIGNANATNDFTNYIPGSGFDIIPVSKVSGSSENWFLDSYWGNGFNIVDYLLYQPNFLNYKSTLQAKLNDSTFWNNVASYDNGIYPDSNQNASWHISDVKQQFTNAINDERFVYPKFDNSFAAWNFMVHDSNSDGQGVLYYYSSIPIINNSIQGVASQPTYFIIGSHSFAPGDIIPTYSEVKGYEFANYHNFTDIADFFDYSDYRVVCSQSQALMINSYGSYNSVSVFIPEDWQSNDNLVTYDFYSYDVNTGVNSKLTSNSPNLYIDYLSAGTLNSYGLPDFLEGFTMLDFIPNGLDNFIISRSDFNTDTYNLNSLIPTPSQSHAYDNNYFNYYDPVTGLTHDENNISLVQPPTKDGNWCVYVLQDNIVESLYVDNADIYRSLPNNPNGLNKQDISFSGIYLDENGNPHTFEYVNPLYHVGDSVWSYSDNFVSSNNNTLTFIGSLSSYFFDNVHSSFFMFCVVALIILIFIKILNFYNGGDR